MEYLLKASIVIAIFYLCYKLFLQGETFFESNRWFLLVGLFTAFIIPTVVIPVYVSPLPNQFDNLAFTNVNTLSETPAETINIFQIIAIAYVLGVLFFSIRFIIQIVSLFQLFRKTEKQKQGCYTFLKTNDDVLPFSFFKWIVYNPKKFKESELHQILTHEKVHVHQYHSIDILISHLATIIFWFNPFMWFYKKDLQQNIEFIADHITHKKVDCKKSYQYLLLKSSVPTHHLALTNNFYNSLIKKRIVMLHKNRSKNKSQWKYLLIIPVLALFLMSFNTKKIIIKNNEIPINQVTLNSLQDNQMVIITKDFSDADFEKVKNNLKKEGLTVKFKGIKRNDSGEITAIKIDVNSKQSNANYNINAEDPINPIKISFDREGGNISIGNSDNIHFGKGDYSFTTKDGKHIIHSSEKGKNEIHFGEDDDVKVHIVKAHKNGKVHTITSEHEIIELDPDSDVDVDFDVESDNDIIIIKKDKDGNIVKEEVIKNKKENVWVIEDDKSFDVQTIGKGKNKVFFLNSDEGEPLVLLDGKEISKVEMEEIEPDTIEKMEVLKGKSAVEKYGEKAKNGVVLITTK